MRIDEWRVEIGKHFPDFVLPAEIGLSVFCQLLIGDISNPFGLVYIGMPSSGKTITLNFFSDIPEHVYTTDNFSPAAFVSHASNVKKDDLEKNDLLPKIRHKVLMVRDLAPLLGQRDDDLLKCMGLLTRVFDGEGLQMDSGLHGQRGYVGDYLFMFLAASTPISPKAWKVMGNFGARLFFLQVDSPDKSSAALAQQLTGEHSVKQMEKICRAKTTDFVRGLWGQHTDVIEWFRKAENKEILEEIALLAQVLACLRGTINVWKENLGGEENYNYTTPQIEKPDRINQALYNLARGHAVACGRRSVDDSDLSIVTKVALSSASQDRIKLFSLLLQNNGVLSTSQITDGLPCSRQTALKLIEVMQLLHLVEEIGASIYAVGRPEKQVMIAQKFRWFIGERFKKLNATFSAVPISEHSVRFA